jgi:hypothetical protein
MPIVQAKVAVAVSGVLKGEENLTVTQVRVFERTYPGEKKILGAKKKGSHRSHTLGWDLYLRKWENQYIGESIGDIAKDLGCNPTILEVEDAYASQIDEKARAMVLYWGEGTSNVQAGINYRNLKRKYTVSHDEKQKRLSSGKKLTKKQKASHSDIKREFSEATLEFPTTKEIPLKQLPKKKRKSLLEDLRDERRELITTGWDTDDEDISSDTETRL